MSGLELYDDEQTIFSLDANRYISNQHHVYAIIIETSEEFDDDNNPIINPQNIQQGAKHMTEGETEVTITARVKVRLRAAEWETIKETVNHDAVIPPELTREVLMGAKTSCISKGSAYYRRKAKSKEGENQSVWQARYYEKSAAMHHIPMTEGTTNMDLRWIPWSKTTEEIWYKILSHPSYLQNLEKTSCQKHRKQHS
jgi:hypothetical protein